MFLFDNNGPLKSLLFSGIITTGSGRFYIESYTLLFRKDRKDWKPYKGALSKEEKVRERH